METQLLIDRHILDMIHAEESRENYMDLVFEDLHEHIEDLEEMLNYEEVK